MRVAANRDVCIGAGMCLVTAPAVFDQDDQGIVVVLTPDVDPGDAAAARQAVHNCPSGALSLIESPHNGGRAGQPAVEPPGRGNSRARRDPTG